MWKLFIEHPSVYCRLFLDFTTQLIADQIDFYTDASGRIRFGGVSDIDWLHGLWDQDWLRLVNPSIEYLELYALVTCVLQWGFKYQNRRVILFCDNKSVVAMVNNTSSTCENCMVLIRKLVLHCMEINTRIFVKYVRTSDNKRADYLSRGGIKDFKMLGYPFAEQATAIPTSICPPSKIWKP